MSNTTVEPTVDELIDLIVKAELYGQLNLMVNAIIRDELLSEYSSIPLPEIQAGRLVDTKALRAEMYRVSDLTQLTMSSIAGVEEAIRYFAATNNISTQVTPEDLPTTISLRAEFAHDIEVLETTMREAGVALRRIHYLLDGRIPDVVVEYQTDVSLETFKAITLTIQDSHVMTDTMKDCVISDNPMER